MSFFSRPEKFSFKDLLASVFSLAFLYFCYCALKDKDTLELVKTLIPLVAIILTGYFAQEGIQTWRQGQMYYPPNSNGLQGNLNGGVAPEPIDKSSI